LALLWICENPPNRAVVVKPQVYRFWERGRVIANKIVPVALDKTDEVDDANDAAGRKLRGPGVAVGLAEFAGRAHVVIVDGFRRQNRQRATIFCRPRAILDLLDALDDEGGPGLTYRKSFHQSIISNCLIESSDIRHIKNMNTAKIEHPELFDPETGLPLPSPRLVEIARQVAGNRLLLSFSGRDSLACWLYLRDQGFELIPYFCYTVPGLSYDDEMLDYYERFFGQHIIRLPHPRTYELFYARAWMPPDVAAMIWRCKLPRFEYSDIERWLAEQFGLGDDHLTGVGIKSADNLMRLRLIRQMGPIGYKKRRYYYAIWDWKTADVKARIEQAGLRLSKSYFYFGSTGDGIDYRFVRYLKDNLPDDYQRVLDVFPESDLELFRYEGVK